MKEKKFYLQSQNMEELLTDWEGNIACLVPDEIMVKGCKVGYCYREAPDEDTEFSKVYSGWRFTAGNEDDDYMDNPENSGIYHLNTLCNYDPDIIPLLKAPYNSAFFRNEEGIFEEEDFEPIE